MANQQGQRERDYLVVAVVGTKKQNEKMVASSPATQLCPASATHVEPETPSFSSRWEKPRPQVAAIH
jgi:hypothetical protein